MIHSFLLSLALLVIITSAVPQDSVDVSGPSSRKIITAWFAAFRVDSDQTLANINWSKFTQMTYAFAETTPDVNTFKINNETILPQFVSQARKHGVKAAVSLGGFGGSRWFSSHVRTAENRTLFVQSVLNLARKYHLDGIDFDWEYPGRQGIGCNEVNTDDTANFLAFLQELRRDKLGSKLILSAATSLAPFTDANGQPSADVSAFAKVFDFIVLMNYDVYGPWTATVGPNGPLTGPCEGSTVWGEKAVDDWNAAGIPTKQLVLGIPAYGHGFRVNQSSAYEDEKQKVLKLYATPDKSLPLVGDKYDPQPPLSPVDACGVPQNSGGTYTFKGMIEAGFLSPIGFPARGVDYRFDECSQTPIVYKKSAELMIAYDDTRSLAIKGRYIQSRGLGGVAMWEEGGDVHDILISSVSFAGGLSF